MARTLIYASVIILNLLVFENKKLYPSSGDSLVHAVNIGNFEKVAYLLDNGAPANAKNKYGIAVLILAAYNGYDRIVELLIQHNADINIRDRDGDTPLLNAVYRNHFKVVQLLFKYGANLNLRNKKGKSAYDVAKEKNFQSIIALLGGSPAPRQTETKKELIIALYKAIKARNYEGVKKVLNKGLNVNIIPESEGLNLDSEFSSSSFLMFAAYYADIKIVKLLIAYRANINYNYYATTWRKNYTSVMTMAVLSNKMDIASFLLQKGIAKDLCDQPLEQALLDNKITIANMLINAGVKDPRKKIENSYFSGSFLARAISKGNLNIVRQMIANGMSVNAEISLPGLNGNITLLYSSIDVKKCHIALFLLQKGANVNKKGEGNPNYALICAIKNCPSLVKLMIQKRAKVNVRDNEGTALQHAIRLGQTENVRLLRAAGAR